MMKNNYMMNKLIIEGGRSSSSSTWELEKAFAEDAAGRVSVGGCIWPPRSYSCSFCHRHFRSAQALGGHMNVHRRDRARLNLNLHHHHLKGSSSISSSSSSVIISSSSSSSKDDHVETGLSVGLLPPPPPPKDLHHHHEELQGTCCKRPKTTTTTSKNLSSVSYYYKPPCSKDHHHHRKGHQLLFQSAHIVEDYFELDLELRLGN